MSSVYECVVSIVNHGYTDLVMEAARSAGARGGTILSGHGTSNREVTEFFGVTITPEKDVVFILVPSAIRDKILSAINAGAGMSTRGMGISFSIPVSDVVGLVQPGEERPDTK